MGIGKNQLALMIDRFDMRLSSARPTQNHGAKRQYFCHITATKFE